MVSDPHYQKNEQRLEEIRLKLLRYFSRLRLPAAARKKVLILEGGGMRGVFTTGVLQAFHDRHYFPWEAVMGSSAGALTGAAYVAGQIHLSRDAFFGSLLSSRFIRLMNIVRPSKHVINLDWMIDSVLHGQEPLDEKKLRRACPLVVTGTHIPPGKHPRTVYFNSHRDELTTILKATAALPFLYRGFVPYRDYELLDGAILDPVPYHHALRLGYREEDIVVVLTREKGYRKEQESFWVRKLLEIYYNKPEYRLLVDVLETRFSRYNTLIDELEKRHPAIEVIYPSPKFHVDRLTTDRAQIASGFHEGVQAGIGFLTKTGFMRPVKPKPPAADDDAD